MLRKGFLEGKFDQFIHQGTSERRSLPIISDILGQGLKQGNFCILRCLRRENLHIFIGDVFHRLVKDEIKIALGLLIP